MKLHGGNLVAEHTSEFQNLINQFASVDLQYEDEIYDLLLLSSLLNRWEMLMISFSNSAHNEKLTMSTVKDAMFNEEARKRAMGMTGSDELRALVSKGCREKYRGQERGQRGTDKG